MGRILGCLHEVFSPDRMVKARFRACEGVAESSDVSCMAQGRGSLNRAGGGRRWQKQESVRLRHHVRKKLKALSCCIFEKT